MSILERGLASSPANFHMKILLIRIYLETGLVGAADHVFTLLDVKHIQLDSLGYLLAPMLAPFGHLFLASATLDHSNKFFVANCKDVCINIAFNYFEIYEILSNLIYNASPECRSLNIRL